MNRIEKISYLRIALNLQGIGIEDEMSDRIIETMDKIERLGGKFSISDAVEIEHQMVKKYAKSKIEVRAKKNKKR